MFWFPTGFYVARSGTKLDVCSVYVMNVESESTRNKNELLYDWVVQCELNFDSWQRPMETSPAHNKMRNSSTESSTI